MAQQNHRVPNNREFVGQQTSIAQEIKRNLRNYNDSQLLAELIQNADDAGATRISFCLDERHHPTERLGGLGQNMPDLQGPSLLCYDDAVFKEENFEGLFKFGIGSKKGDPTQTGRFGLGFNSIFHITDCPMLLSGKRLLILDPQRKYLQGVIDNPQVNPGVSLIWSQEQDGVSNDLLSPFESTETLTNFHQKSTHHDHDSLRKRINQSRQASSNNNQEGSQSGPNYEGNYQGTVFRFPLRSPKQAKESLFRKNETSIDDVWSLLKQLISNGVDSLLLLQHLSHLKVFRWREGDTRPTLFYTLELACIGTCENSHLIDAHTICEDDSNQGMDNYRYELHEWTRSLLRKWSQEKRRDWREEGASLALSEQLRQAGSTAAPRRTVRIRAVMTYGTGGGVSGGGGTVGGFVEEEWWLRYGLGKGSSWTMATCEEAKDAEHALWPAVTVAARLWSCINNSNGKVYDRRPVNGYAFAALKLHSMPTNFPLHISARWALSDNRRDLIRGKARSELMQRNWNLALLTDAVPAIWSELLVDLRCASLPLASYYSLWPSFASGGTAGLCSQNMHEAEYTSSSALMQEAVGPTLLLLADLPVMRCYPKNLPDGAPPSFHTLAYIHGTVASQNTKTPPVKSGQEFKKVKGSGSFFSKGLSLLGGVKQDSVETSDGIGEASTEWLPCKDVTFTHGLVCPDLPPLVCGPQDRRGQEGGGSVSADLMYSTGLVGGEEVLYQPNTAGPLIHGLVVATGDSGREARIHWFKLILIYELGTVKKSQRLKPIELFRRAAWRLVRWIRHGSGCLASRLAKFGFKGLCIAPSSMIPKLRRAAMILRDKNNNSEVYHEQLLAFENLGRVSSQKLIMWLEKTMPLVPVGNGNRLNLFIQNHVHVEAVLRLVLRDTYESELSFLDKIKDGEILHGFGEVVNVAESQRSYSSVYGNNAVGTGHARSRLNSPQGWSAAINDESQFVEFPVSDKLERRLVVGLLMQARGNNNQFVKSIKGHVYCKDAQGNPIEIHKFNSNDEPISTGLHLQQQRNNDKNSTAVLRLPYPRGSGTHVKIQPLSWQQHISLRCAVVVAHDCHPPLPLPCSSLAQLPISNSPPTMQETITSQVLLVTSQPLLILKLFPAPYRQLFVSPSLRYRLVQMRKQKLDVRRRWYMSHENVSKLTLTKSFGISFEGCDSSLTAKNRVCWFGPKIFSLLLSKQLPKVWRLARSVNFQSLFIQSQSLTLTLSNTGDNGGGNRNSLDFLIDYEWIKRVWKYLQRECDENGVKSSREVVEREEVNLFGNVYEDARQLIATWPLLPVQGGKLIRGDLSKCCLRQDGTRDCDFEDGYIASNEKQTVLAIQAYLKGNTSQTTSHSMQRVDEEEEQLKAAIAASLAEVQGGPFMSSNSLSSGSKLNGAAAAEEEDKETSALKSSVVNANYDSVSSPLSVLMRAGVPLISEAENGVDFELPRGTHTFDNSHSRGRVSDENRFKSSTALFHCQEVSPLGALRAIHNLELCHLRCDVKTSANENYDSSSSSSSSNFHSHDKKVGSDGSKDLIDVIKFDPSDWSKEERQILLHWFSASLPQFTSFELDVLSSLPLFEREDGVFVSIRECEQPRTIPDDMPGIDMIADKSQKQTGFMIFRKKPVFALLYEALGLAELSEEELYVTHILPRFHELNIEARLGHLKHALAIAKLMTVDKREKFKSILSSVPCVPIHGKLEAARDLFDPSPSLPFASLMPEKCVPLNLADDWLPSLLEAGTASTCNRVSFMNIAVEVASTGDVYRAKALLKLLVRSYRELETETSHNQAETEGFFSMIAELPLVNPKKIPGPWMPSSGSVRISGLLPIAFHLHGQTLLPLSACCDYSDFDLCWSQSPVIGDSTLYISSYLKKLLKMPCSPPPPEMIAKHLLWLSRQPSVALQEIRSLDHTCHLCYSALSMACTLEPESRNKISDILQDQEVILKKSIRYASTLTSQKVSSPPSKFVAGSLVFAYLPFDLAPMALHKNECCSFFSNAFTTSDLYGSTTLAKLLGMNMQPTPQHVGFWMQQFTSKGDRYVLSDGELSLVVNLLLTLSDMEESEERDSILMTAHAPNSKKILKPASQLLVDDAPWLAGRVNYDAIDMAHDLLTTASVQGESLVEVLGFRRLSKVVKEVLQPGFTPIVSQPQPNEMNRFNHVLRSVAFRNGIRQVIRHEKEMADSSKRSRGNILAEASTHQYGNRGVSSGSLSSTDLLRRLFLLESVTVIGCNHIQISYLVDGVDVTNSTGSSDVSSDYLLVDNDGHDEKSLFINTSSGGARLWVNCVVMAIKHNVLCADYPQNLLPISMMIETANTADNEQVLNRKFNNILRSHRISALKMSDHLGEALPQSSVNRLNLNQLSSDADLKSGDEVVYVDLSSSNTGSNAAEEGVGGSEAVYRYGRLVRCLGDVWELEDTATSTRCLRTNQIISMKAPSLSDQSPGLSSDIVPMPPPIEVPMTSEEKSQVEQAASGETVHRIRYTPSDPNWLDKEEALLAQLKAADEEKMKQLEEELPGSNDILVKNGFVVKDQQSAAADALSRIVSGTLAEPSIRKGMDLVRVGNLGSSGVAFFYDRKKMPPPLQLTTFIENKVVPALFEVCKVFNYDARFVTLFQEPDSPSRFVRQRILVNTDPIMKRLSEQKKNDPKYDISKDPFLYCYLYGLMIHKLAHFHDIVHGTRHDYYMNELRIEFIEPWIELLERQGFDPGQVESSQDFRHLVKQLRPGQFVQ